MGYATLKLQKVCITCHEQFFKSYSECKGNWEKRKYCSHKCQPHFAIKGSFATRKLNKKCLTCLKIFSKKYNEGKRDWLIRKYCSLKCQKRLSQENSPLWKGNKISYSTVHKWLAKNFPKPITCEACGTPNYQDIIGRRQIQWANKSGKYFRDIRDFIALCRDCHNAYDQSCRLTS